MATTEFTYKGRRIWIDPYVAAQGWQVKAEIWEVGKQGLVKDETRLPANYYFHSLQAARDGGQWRVPQWGSGLTHQHV